MFFTEYVFLYFGFTLINLKMIIREFILLINCTLAPCNLSELIQQFKGRKLGSGCGMPSSLAEACYYWPFLSKV